MRVPFWLTRAHYDTWTVRGERLHAGMKERLTQETAANTPPRLRAPILVVWEIWYRAKMRDTSIAGKVISCSSEVLSPLGAIRKSHLK
jgi:hypothetical protein